jgi:hypothetical protein
MLFGFGRRGGLRRIGPAGIAFALSRAWRHLSPHEKEQIKGRLQALRTQLRSQMQRSTLTKQ